MVCPECKDVIPEGTLHGNHKNCHACWVRENRDDLIELDTEKALEALALMEQQALPAQTQPQNQTGVRSVLSGLSYAAKKLAESRMESAADEPPIPVIHNLNDLELTPGAYWDHSAESWSQAATLVIKAQGTKSLFIFSLVWLGFTVPVLSAVLIMMIHDPSSVKVNHRPGTYSDLWIALLFPLIFWGVGGGLLYWSIMSCFSKTWIDVHSDLLFIERGLRRKGQTQTVKRSPKTLVTMESGGSINHTPVYAVFISDGTKIKIGSGMYQAEAQQLVRMLKTLVAAQI